MASHKIDAVSSREIRLRAAFSFSRLGDNRAGWHRTTTTAPHAPSGLASGLIKSKGQAGRTLALSGGIPRLTVFSPTRAAPAASFISFGGQRERGFSCL